MCWDAANLWLISLGESNWCGIVLRHGLRIASIIMCYIQGGTATMLCTYPRVALFCGLGFRAMVWCELQRVNYTLVE